MAIDSREKRTSAAGVGRPYLRATHTDASKGAGWRQSVGLTYAGANLSPAVDVAQLEHGGLIINIGTLGVKGT